MDLGSSLDSRVGAQDNERSACDIEVSISRLSEREQLILTMLVSGSPNKIIARRLDITEATVKVHMKSIMRKIRASNRTQAAIWAAKNGIVTPVDYTQNGCQTASSLSLARSNGGH
ncbi:response regulator transcription factor [Methylobacterium sp. P31]